MTDIDFRVFQLLWECCWVENHSQIMIRYLKSDNYILKSSTFVCVKAFPMYGGIGISTPSLESTDSLIYFAQVQSLFKVCT